MHTRKPKTQAPLRILRTRQGFRTRWLGVTCAWSRLELNADSASLSSRTCSLGLNSRVSSPPMLTSATSTPARSRQHVGTAVCVARIHAISQNMSQQQLHIAARRPVRLATVRAVTLVASGRTRLHGAGFSSSNHPSPRADISAALTCTTRCRLNPHGGGARLFQVPA